jgi:hypothetical protein
MITNKDNLYPQFPLYIPSKGRSQYMTTSKSLTKMGIRHYIVVESNEIDKYKESISNMNLLADVIELDMSYKTRYDLLDNFGLTKSTGPGPARNFIWDHAIANGSEWHWVMDDNIKSFRIFNHNRKIRVYAPQFWRCMEDFCLRYTNVAMAGPAYCMFIPGLRCERQFSINTRIYSCNLIRNDVPFRWRGRYNEDTILSLDMLKMGWCTVQFNALLQEKMNTQTIKGGNSDDFYFIEGTLAKSKMQVNTHPDISRLVFKYGRWHHHVDYSRFKKNMLIKRDDIEICKGVDNYGMIYTDDYAKYKNDKDR